LINTQLQMPLVPMIHLDYHKILWTVTVKILMLCLSQKLNNYRGSNVRDDRQFELHLQND